MLPSISDSEDDEVMISITSIMPSFASFDDEVVSFQIDPTSEDDIGEY